MLTGRAGGSLPGMATSPRGAYPGGPTGRHIDSGRAPGRDDLHTRLKSIDSITSGISWLS